MPTRTTVLIILLTTLTGVLLFFALTSDQKVPQTSKDRTSPVPTKEIVNGKAKLYFDPTEINVKLSASNTATVNVVLNSDEHIVTGVQVEALYDPQVLTNVTINTAQNSFFSINEEPTVVLFKEVEPLTGKVSYVEGIQPGGKAVNGIGNIATITFRVNPTTTETQSTIILLDSSMVSEDSDTHAGASVLGGVTPLKINIVK